MARKAAIILTNLLILIVSSMVVFSNAADNIVEGCLYQDQMWGSVDGTKFYICIPGTNMAIEQDCPEGNFFVRNSTVTGCVPFDSVDSNCVYTGEVESCTGINLKQPQPANNPTQFYLCTAEGADPILLNCGDGSAFVRQDGYLGCFLWPEWRAIRECYDDQ